MRVRWCESSDEITLCSCSLTQDRSISLCLFATQPQRSSLAKNLSPVFLRFCSLSSCLHSVCEQGRFNCTQERCQEVNRCPGSLIYSPRSCLLTCSSLDPPGQQQGSSVAQSSCREPLSGCICPQGTVLLVAENSHGFLCKYQ